MSKEMFVSLTPHETKVAVTEDDLLAEVYFERENEYTLAGSIYKGRVTRVLPGMQSAFVDIGLERDAFLYVSDFLELEDDEDQVEPVRVIQPAQEEPVSHFQQPRRDGRQEQRRDRFRRPERRPEPAAAPEPAAEFEEHDLPAPMIFEGGEGVDEIEGSVPEAAAETPQPPQRSAPRRDEEGEDRGNFRGRRGRRGRRGGRGFPENKFAEEAQPREERAPSREERPARPERPSFREERPSYGPPAGYTPILLPGESISKYQRYAAPQPAVVSQPEVSQDQGESQSGFEYEAKTATPPYAEPEASPVAESALTEPAQASTEPPVIEAPAFQQEYVETPVSEEAERTAEQQMASTPVIAEEQPWRRTAKENRAAAEEEKRRYEQMNVASIFGGTLAADADAPGEHAPLETSGPEKHGEAAEMQQPMGAHDDSASRNAASFLASPHGTVEHEEIEDEEADLPTYDQHLDVDDFEELEEETLEPLAAAPHEEHAGEELTEAVEETEEEAATEEEYEGEENGEEFEEGEEEGEEEGDLTRAEVRGPNGAAGYQQRTQRTPSPDFDRRRGRRGGRRMRQRTVQRQQIQISDLLKEGQEVLVQIAKEPIGKKGARITSHIALPGRFMVYMPTVNHVGVSRKIASDEERQRLKRIVSAEREGHGGFIVRTAADGVSEEELKQDIKFLKGLWNEIKTRADNAKPPSLIYHDLNLVERLLRDLLNDDFTHIWVDNEAEYERILRFVNRFQPGLVRRVRMYTKETPLFEQFGVQEEINKALKSKVWLKSGGYIVINQTEALVAIDVNTGKYVGKTTRLEDTIVKTNVDAIKEIVRQVRLRDLGGIIVIDFIDMDERKNRQKVMQALEEALRSDRAPSKVLQFNDFGLVAITRKRVKHSLERVLGQPCPICTGTGLVKSPETVCNEIYVEVRKMRKHFEGREVLLRVNPEVAKVLKGNNAKWLNELEELTGKTIIVKADAALHPEQFDL